MKGCTALVCFLASISVGEARIKRTEMFNDEESTRMLVNRSLVNRTLSEVNRSLFDDFDRSLFNRSLESDGNNFNRSLYNRSLESRRLLEDPNINEEDSEWMPLRGLYNRTLQANRTLTNRTLQDDEFELAVGGYNRSLEFQDYNRSLFSEHNANRSLSNQTM